jgi:hypothetical protein
LGAQSNHRRHLGQSEVSRHRPEIAIIVQQRPTIFDAPGSDQEIDGLANGHAASAQRPEIAGRRDHNRISRHRHDFEAAQKSLDLTGSPFAIQTLQNLAKDQIAENDLLPAASSLQRHDLMHAVAIKETDPYAAVDERSNGFPPGPAPRQVAPPAILAKSGAAPLLPAQPDHQPKRLLKGLLFVCVPGSLLGFRHKSIIDVDIGTHDSPQRCV